MIPDFIMLSLARGTTTRLINPRLRAPIQSTVGFASIPRGTSQSRISHTFRNMSKDYTVWSDISKSKSEPDGSFKRQDSTFRNFIEEGGKYAPEKGQ